MFYVLEQDKTIIFLGTKAECQNYVLTVMLESRTIFRPATDLEYFLWINRSATQH